MTGDERDRFDQIVGERGGFFPGIRALLVSFSMCDEQGGSLGFTEAEVKQLGTKGASVIDRLFEKAQLLSGIDGGAVEESKKNSPADPSESSG